MTFRPTASAVPLLRSVAHELCSVDSALVMVVLEQGEDVQIVERYEERDEVMSLPDCEAG